MVIVFHLHVDKVRGASAPPNYAVCDDDNDGDGDHDSHKYFDGFWGAALLF
jgi:hypothetical protein